MVGYYAKHTKYRQVCQIFKHPATPQKSLELLHSMFKLWVFTRLLAMPAYIIGEETLRMDQYLLSDTQILVRGRSQSLGSLSC